jgi:L-alanine-DL-glutamate epimerase-like enolase superfamily enzyme
MRRLTVARERWPIAGTFTIARGSKTEADVVVVRVEEKGAAGRGEGVPYPRYHETPEMAIAALEQARPVIEAGLAREDIGHHVKPMAACNALDCALWDLEAKQTSMPVWKRAGLPQPVPCETAFTISLAPPATMAEQAAEAAQHSLLKLKLGRDDDEARLHAVRKAAPKHRLIVDANEGWTAANVERMLAACRNVGVELVEQPLPAGDDEMLSDLSRAVPVCADESVHGVESLDRLMGMYDAINIKLDKTGGLTPALALLRAAEMRGFTIMVGCMLATSLAMAPAFLLSPQARFVDLDGPLLLKRDREPGIRYEGALMHPAPSALWG